MTMPHINRNPGIFIGIPSPLIIIFCAMSFAKDVFPVPKGAAITLIISGDWKKFPSFHSSPFSL